MYMYVCIRTYFSHTHQQNFGTLLFWNTYDQDNSQKVLPIHVAISYNIVRTCPTYPVVTRSQKRRLLVSVVRQRLTFKPIQNRTISSVAHKTVTASSSTIVTKFSAKKGAVNLLYNTNKPCPLHACTISVTAPFLVPRPLPLQPKLSGLSRLRHDCIIRNFSTPYMYFRPLRSNHPLLWEGSV